MAKSTVPTLSPQDPHISSLFPTRSLLLSVSSAIQRVFFQLVLVVENDLICRNSNNVYRRGTTSWRATAWGRKPGGTGQLHVSNLPALLKLVHENSTGFRNTAKNQQMKAGSRLQILSDHTEVILAILILESRHLFFLHLIRILFVDNLSFFQKSSCCEASIIFSQWHIWRIFRMCSWIVIGGIQNNPWSCWEGWQYAFLIFVFL